MKLGAIHTAAEVEATLSHSGSELSLRLKGIWPPKVAEATKDLPRD